jgi:hypothetical protein
MAIAHCFFFHAPFTTRRKPLVIVSSKTGQRKNYLRPKILKTLTKPSLSISPTLLQPPIPQPILSPPQEHELCVDIPADEMHGEDIAGAVDETGEFEGLRVSVDTAKDNRVFGNVSAKEIFKYGGIYLIGAFVFQTVRYLWNSRNEHSNGDLEVSEREKRNILFGGNGKTVEDQLVERKIEEIKLMAREARRIELLEKQGKREEEENGDPEIDGIEKEIGERLLKLKNRIKSNKDSSAALRLNGRGNSAGGGDMSVNPGKEELVFKKKSKFKSPSTKATKTPKGFPGTQDHRVSCVKPQGYGNQVTDHAGILDGDKQVNQQDVTHKNASGVPLEEKGKSVDDESGKVQNEGENLEEMMETPNRKTKDGVTPKSINNGNVINA